MKKVKKILSIVLATVMLLGMAACGSGGEQVEQKKEKGKTKVSFWVEINDGNMDALTEIVNNFNSSNSDVYVTIVPQSAGSASSLSTSLRGSNAPDIVMIDDKVFKGYVEEGLLSNLDSYIAADTNPNFDLSDMWESSVNRFSYDPETGMSGTGADQYAIPAGNNPTFLYYNVDLFEEQNVNIISVPEDEITGNLLPHGYYVYDSAPIDGMVAREDGKYHVFNNRIPMNWEELVELSKIFTKSYNATSSSTYGFMNEWWFSHGWSVGGDCLEWSEEKQQYVFELGDTTANYLVTENVSVNGTAYQAGDILSYQDKNYVEANLDDEQIAAYISDESLYELPSMMDAFTEFTRLSQESGKAVTASLNGYGVSPSPSTMANNTKTSYFTTGEVAILCEEANAAHGLGKQMDMLGKSWDVAPMYQYREYNEDGTVKEVNGTKIYGKQATHSYVSAYAIPENSKNKEAAWAFLSYLTGTDGESIMMTLNQTVPNQKSLAYSDAYLNDTSNYAPSNKIAIVDMANIATMGDWAYVEDSLWIGDWSNLLNTKVRNGLMTLEEFFSHEDVTKTDELLKEYKSVKYNG